jgi:hypothetical protein
MEEEKTMSIQQNSLLTPVAALEAAKLDPGHSHSNQMP